jgi:hypothetical protein
MKFQKDAINDLCPNFYSPKERVTLLLPTLITLSSKNVKNFQTYAITDLCPNFNSPKERVTLLPCQLQH